MCARLGAEVPGHRQKQLRQTLFVRLLKTHYLHRYMIVKSRQNRIELVTRPGFGQPHFGRSRSGPIDRWSPRLT